MFQGQDCLHRMLRLLCLQDFGQREMLRRVQEYVLFLVCFLINVFIRQAANAGGKYNARGPNLALHLVLSGPAPRFYPLAAPSSWPLVKEYLHLCSPNITFGPLKATTRLMWPLVKMSLTPLP